MTRLAHHIMWHLHAYSSLYNTILSGSGPVKSPASEIVSSFARGGAGRPSLFLFDVIPCLLTEHIDSEGGVRGCWLRTHAEGHQIPADAHSTADQYRGKSAERVPRCV